MYLKKKQKNVDIALQKPEKKRWNVNVVCTQQQQPKVRRRWSFL